MNDFEDEVSLNTMTSGLARCIDYDVMDDGNQKIGTLNSFWVDREGHPLFLGVKTGRVFGKTHVVPIEVAKVNESAHSIRLLASEDAIRCAPVFEADKSLGVADEREVYRYFDIDEPTIAEARLDPASRPPPLPYVKVPSADACNAPLASPKPEQND